ncbi:5-hydroxytryptamine receptor 4-like [Centroberyx gerrardi]
MICIPGINASENHSLAADGSTSALLLQSTAAKVCVLCLLLPIPIFAMLGNLLIMAAVARFQSLQTPTDAFVVSLAMADFLVAALVMPFSLVRSIDTCAAQQENQTCLAAFHVPYALATSTVCFFIPVGFMLFAYGKILLAARRQARWIHAMEHQAGQLQMSRSPTRADPSRQGQASVESGSLKKERKAAKTLGLLMGVFLFCWLPFFSVSMAHPLWGYSISPVVLEASMWLGYANSSLNPFLYASFNRSYRRTFVAILGCGILGRQLRACLDSSHFDRQAHTVVT